MKVWVIAKISMSLGGVCMYVYVYIKSRTQFKVNDQWNY